ncbi:MAG: hypothetical protein LBI92_10580 [Azoarcus sp.]|jgi:hypothetical protein|nr:hypothetical protein [Azoarcus sp.]
MASTGRALTFEEKKSRILDINTELKFKCIDAANPGNIKSARETFIDAVEKRRNDPTYIEQGGSSLCGPAAFLYCVAREKPDDFAHYALDLALEGKGSLGNLIVEPGSACLGTERLQIGQGTKAGTQGTKARTITPADWVTLASLRDSTGRVSSMDSVTSDLGGMTHPDALAGWFGGTGWFRDVRNEARIAGTHDPLRHLLGINSLPLSYVCLLINANIMTGGVVFRIPTHWVVLGDGAGKGGGSNGNDGSVIRIGMPGTTGTPVQHEIAERAFCLPDSPACVSSNDPRAARRAALEKGKLNFRVYSWGGNDYDYERAGRRGIKTVDFKHPGGLTVEKFLPAYFGYVTAAVK